MSCASECISMYHEYPVDCLDQSPSALRNKRPRHAGFCTMIQSLLSPSLDRHLVVYQRCMSSVIP